MSELSNFHKYNYLLLMYITTLTKANIHEDINLLQFTITHMQNTAKDSIRALYDFLHALSTHGVC